MQFILRVKTTDHGKTLPITLQVLFHVFIFLCRIYNNVLENGVLFSRHSCHGITDQL